MQTFPVRNIKNKVIPYCHYYENHNPIEKKKKSKRQQQKNPTVLINSEQSSFRLFNSNGLKAWPMYNNGAQYINNYCATCKFLLHFLVFVQIEFIVPYSCLMSVPRRLEMMPNRSRSIKFVSTQMPRDMK